MGIGPEKGLNFGASAPAQPPGRDAAVPEGYVLIRATVLDTHLLKTNDLEAERNALRDQADVLAAALRKHALRPVRGASGEPYTACAECQAVWGHDQPEYHAYGCVVVAAYRAGRGPGDVTGEKPVVACGAPRTHPVTVGSGRLPPMFCQKPKGHHGEAHAVQEYGGTYVLWGHVNMGTIPPALVEP